MYNNRERHARAFSGDLDLAEHANKSPVPRPESVELLSPAGGGPPVTVATDLDPRSVISFDALRELIATLPVLRVALERAARTKPSVDRMALRFDEVAASLGVSRRLLERELAAGRFVKPDVYIGRVPLWRVENVRAYLEQGDRP
jgi:hypothetical protein